MRIGRRWRRSRPCAQLGRYLVLRKRGVNFSVIALFALAVGIPIGVVARDT